MVGLTPDCVPSLLSRPHRVVVGVDEVGVVGQPAHTEHDQDHDKHLRQLNQNIFVKISKYIWVDDPYLPLVPDLPPVAHGVCGVGGLVPPEHRSQVAVGNAQPHHRQHVRHQEEHHLDDHV